MPIMCLNWSALIHSCKPVLVINIAQPYQDNTLQMVRAFTYHDYKNTLSKKNERSFLRRICSVIKWFSSCSQ